MEMGREVTEQIVEIPISKIESHGNMRTNFDANDLSELMTSMKQQGLLQPIRIQPAEVPGKYDLIYGNRRITAARKLGWKLIPAIVQNRASDQDTLMIHGVENIHQSTMPMCDEGKLYTALLEEGLQVTEVSARMGVPGKRINMALKLYRNVPAEFRDKVKSLGGRGMGGKKGVIPASSAYEISKITAARKEMPAEEIRKLFKYAEKDGVTHKHISAIASRLKDGTKTLDEVLETADDLNFHAVMFTVPARDSRVLTEKFGSVQKAVIHFLKTDHPEYAFELFDSRGGTGLQKQGGEA